MGRGEIRDAKSQRGGVGIYKNLLELTDGQIKMMVMNVQLTPPLNPLPIAMGRGS